jgi:hypothetical protein
MRYIIRYYSEFEITAHGKEFESDQQAIGYACAEFVKCMKDDEPLVFFSVTKELSGARIFKGGTYEFGHLSPRGD